MLAELVILIVFPALMAIAASMDVLTMTISNKLSLALIAGFAVAALLVGLPLGDIGMHLLAGLVMLILGFTLFCCRFVGGGDAKFFAATALWIGWENLLTYMIVLSMIGGLWTVIILVWRNQPLPLFLMNHGWIDRLHQPKGDIPYGVALAAGGLIVYPSTIWFAAVV
ncbi:MAG: prepilin peptidase [Pseudomonadota bacterium]